MASDILGKSWNITQQGEDIITVNKTIKDKATILKNALNSDLKETGSPILTKLINKSEITQVVLQIQKIRNIAAPKANENSHVAPRMLKFTLTDGDSYIQGVEVTPIPSINQDKTPPGSKLLIHSAKISSGYLLLDSTNCSLLGGRVPALYEKWELARSVQHHNRQNYNTDGPPTWVNFGCKIQSDLQDKSFKSLDNKNQDVKENTKFDLQRQDAIAEAATSGAVKKVFGGGMKQTPITPTVIHKKNDFQNKEKKNYKSKTTIVKDIEEKPQKPSERVSLFDFLENKLPVNEIEPPSKPNLNNNYNPNYQQNNRNRNYNVKPTGYTNKFENNQNRVRKEVKSQPPPPPQPRKSEENDIDGLSNNLGKMSLNSQFASRSLRQHLNLAPPQKKNEMESVNNFVNWKVGDECMAKYWEDGKYYNAYITAITERTCVIKFKGYGNIEEVLKIDCLPLTRNDTTKRNPHNGPMEFKRNTRTFRRQ